MPPRIEQLSFPIPGDRTFDEIIDVRAPVEYAVDHLKGAINLPVLNDEERERVGTLYAQESPFIARKLGAALVSRNISHHLETHFADKPKEYSPLVYCFRGGQRSRSLATILREIGWQVTVVEGGYKSYRRHVISTLEDCGKRLNFRVINGLTGSGKTLILKALESEGAQVLDLEGIANHKGSVFGADLETPQPAQKRFESMIYDQLSGFEAGLPVFVEAESPKIGKLNIPVSLWRPITESPVTEIVTSLESRVAYLENDYAEWLAIPDHILATIDRLKAFHSRETIQRWKQWCAQGEWASLIGDLLERHYDRNYGTDGSGHYPAPERKVVLRDHGEQSVRECARELLSAHSRSSTELVPA